MSSEMFDRKDITAAEARELMPNRFNEMIERIYNHIRNMAIIGKSVATVTFSSDFNVEGLFFKVKDFLEKEEGYEVYLTNGKKDTEFLSAGASPKNFSKILSVDAVRAELLKFNGAKPSHTFSQFALLNFFNSNEWARS